MEILSIKNLSFSYPKSEKKVIDSLSMSIEQGDFVVLFGRTGCGKTTLLKLIKKELSPAGEEKGEVLFCGVDKKNLSLRDSAEGIGFVMQDAENQIVTDKVWHELSFYMENLGYPSEKISLRVGELSNYFGITPWYGKDTVHLSGGQKQLLTLASVMTATPKLLILDEPTSKLDPISAREFISTLKKINTELGTTILLCEHRLEEVLPVADKALYMEEGKVAFSGTPRKVCSHLAGTTYEKILPVPSRVFLATGGKGELPLSVKEGRAYLSEKSLKPSLPQTERRAEKKTLEMKNVWFRYEKGEADVLKGADLIVYQNEILSVVGGNGSGKSTMLKLLAGIKKPYRGKIFLDGKNISGILRKDLYKNNIAYLPQNPKTVFMHDRIGDDLGKNAEEEITAMGVGELLERHPHDLSGGELQKCAIAKILTKKPRVLLLDEPTKGLDGFAKEELIGLLKELKKDRTIVLVTHDVEFAALASDRCCLLFGGETLPPAHPQKFFTDNYYYTTSASRLSRGKTEGVVTCEQLISALNHDED